MSITPGYFAETILQNVRTRADRIGLDAVLSQQYKPFALVLKTLNANQMATLNYVLNSKKDIVVDVEWLNACGIVAEDNTDCEFGGSELSSNVEQYAFNYLKSAKFTVKEKSFKNNDFGFEDALAKGLLRAQKVLLENFAQWTIAQLNTFGGVNQMNNGIGNIQGNMTYIPSANWNLNTIAYLMRVAEMMNMGNPMVLSGANLHQQKLVADSEVGPEGSKLWSELPIFFDERNIDGVNSPDMLTYLIDKTSYAIANKADFNPAPETFNGVYIRQSMKSNYVPLEFDVIYQYVCDHDLIALNVKVKLKAGFYKNPSGCDGSNTGILTFKCGEVPTL